MRVLFLEPYTVHLLPDHLWTGSHGVLQELTVVAVQILTAQSKVDLIDSRFRSPSRETKGLLMFKCPRKICLLSGNASISSSQHLSACRHQWRYWISWLRNVHAGLQTDIHIPTTCSRQDHSSIDRTLQQAVTNLDIVTIVRLEIGIIPFRLDCNDFSRHQHRGLDCSQLSSRCRYEACPTLHR